MVSLLLNVALSLAAFAALLAVYRLLMGPDPESRAVAMDVLGLIVARVATLRLLGVVHRVVVVPILEGLDGSRVRQIPKMLGGNELARPGQTNRVFQFRTHREHGTVHSKRSWSQWRRDIPPCPTYHGHPQRGPAHHGIVAGVVNPSIMEQKKVGDSPQPLHRLLVIRNQGLARQVSRRHHEHLGCVLHQNVVERRVGEHDPQFRQPRCH